MDDKTESTNGTASVALGGKYSSLRTRAQHLLRRFAFQLNLCLYLMLPMIYLDRIMRPYRESQITDDEFDALSAVIDDGTERSAHHMTIRVPYGVTRFYTNWRSLIAKLQREWESLNVISALLITIVVTLLQIEGIEGDPLARTATLLSLMASLMSLLFQW
ncbi:hypothetical protein HGRIS_003130 [Hohenbuehelia grisea]|uniref:SMODS and SLOG-associating 2TM effector domain-containing protein n=1 Tax=Hohenbuehelia grisea TaxID=104357 RepID=A0ABR3JMK0_9AGAR